MENSSALQERWPAGPEGFPAHATIPHGKRKCHYAPAWQTKQPLWLPRGCEPPPPFGARPPARRDSSFLPASTAGIQKFVKAGTLYHSILSIRFFQMVLNPQECGLFPVLGLPVLTAGIPQPLRGLPLQKKAASSRRQPFTNRVSPLSLLANEWRFLRGETTFMSFYLFSHFAIFSPSTI